jgi:hypothetical protein
VCAEVSRLRMSLWASCGDDLSYRCDAEVGVGNGVVGVEDARPWRIPAGPCPASVSLCSSPAGTPAAHFWSLSRLRDTGLATWARGVLGSDYNQGLMMEIPEVG